MAAWCGDRQLMPGDGIFIPPLGDTVSVYGAVRRPAIDELKAAPPRATGDVVIRDGDKLLIPK